MEEESKSRTLGCDAGNGRTTLLLSVGFCGASGLLAATIIGVPLPLAFVFILLAAIGLPWGLGRLADRKAKARPVIVAATVAVVLSPVYVPAGIVTGLLIPTIPSRVKWFFTGPDVIKSVTSPDENFEAYVVEKPSIDPPNQSLYVQRSDNIHFVNVAHLAEDIDSILNIRWSPDSDIVVFHTRCNLIAAHVPGYQIVRIPLGGEWTRTKASKRSTFCGAQPRLAVADIQFPQSGSFSYRLEGTDAFKTVRMDSFQ